MLLPMVFEGTPFASHLAEVSTISFYGVHDGYVVLHFAFPIPGFPSPVTVAFGETSN
jgi:hypothetical protein